MPLPLSATETVTSSLSAPTLILTRSAPASNALSTSSAIADAWGVYPESRTAGMNWAGTTRLALFDRATKNHLHSLIGPQLGKRISGYPTDPLRLAVGSQ